MRSLWLKLMGAFVAVILIGITADSFLVSRATSGQFSRYVTQNGQAWAQRLAPTLANYYARTGSWQGVEAWLRAPWAGMMGMDMAQTAPGWGNEGWVEPGMGMMGRGMGGMRRPEPFDGAQDRPVEGMGHDMGGMMDGDGWEMGPGMMDGDMWAWMGVRLLLADERGTIIADTTSSTSATPGSGLTGTTLEPADLAMGTPVLVDGRQVGTLLSVAPTAAADTPAGDFLSAVNRSTWLAGLAAGALALVFGLLIFRQIVAPVRAVTAAAQRVAGGRLDQRVPVTSQDEIGQLAQAFNQMADALARNQQLRRNMIADIAHELRTPLSVIQANLEAMLDGVLPTSPEEIASLHDETTLLSRLVADLRLLSLAEAGQLKLERSPTDLGELVSKVVEHMRFQAEAGGVDLAADVPPGLPPVNVDADRISQVIGNLVSNALRYTPAGGRVSIQCSVRSEHSTENSEQPRRGTKLFTDHVRRIDGRLLITVTDTGQGIPSEDLPHVFDRFYRADKSRSRTSGGSGIGLAIVKQLVEAHGGQVWVESPAFNGAGGPGYGTRFSFTLPITAEPPTLVNGHKEKAVSPS